MKRYYNYIQITILILLLSVSCVPLNSNVNNEMAGKIVEQKEDNINSESEKVSDFILEGGDSIEISVFRHDELRRSVKIDPSGKIMFPLIGDLVVVNKGIYELREELKERLSKYIENPQVLISVSGIQSQKFLVLGEVSSPGSFMLDSKLKVSDAILKAGSYTQYANISSILLIRRGRGKVDISKIDFEEIIKKGKLSQDDVIQNGDIVYVPTKTIVSISRFMQNISNILSPIVGLESATILVPQVIDVITGNKSTTSVSITAQ